MRNRTGWVSNSSSCSFIIKNYNISERQKDWIKNPKEYFRAVCKDKWEEMSWDQQTDYDEDFENFLRLKEEEVGLDWSSEWSIYEEDDHLSFYTTMDNFNYVSYIELVGIDRKYIEDLDW